MPPGQSGRGLLRHVLSRTWHLWGWLNCRCRNHPWQFFRPPGSIHLYGECLICHTRSVWKVVAGFQPRDWAWLSGTTQTPVTYPWEMPPVEPPAPPHTRTSTHP